MQTEVHARQAAVEYSVANADHGRNGHGIGQWATPGSGLARWLSPRIREVRKMTGPGYARTIGVLAVLLTPMPLWASSYEVGDTDAGKGLKLKSQVSYLRNDSEVSWARPSVEFGWGFAERLELTVGGGYGLSKVHGEENVHGHEGLRLALKWRIHGDPDESFGVAVEPELLFPTGSRSLRGDDGHTLLSLPFRVSRQLQKTLLTGQIARQHPLGSDETIWSVGGLVEHEVATGLWLGAEIIHEESSSQRGKFQRGNVGFRWDVSDGWSLFGAFGRSFSHNEDGMHTSARAGFELSFD